MGRWVHRPRHEQWQIWVEDQGKYSNDQVQHAILMDIREYLLQLVTLLNCSNALAIPSILRDIAAHTKPRKRKRKKAR